MWASRQNMPLLKAKLIAAGAPQPEDKKSQKAKKVEQKKKQQAELLAAQ